MKEGLASGLSSAINLVSLAVTRNKEDILSELIRQAERFNYTVVDVDINKPWGGYVRFDAASAEDFAKNFFPQLDMQSIRLGRRDVDLSPKFLLVKPGARLSWQVHARRAELWHYLTPGGYHKSNKAEHQGDLYSAPAGTEVQFSQGECHRLVGTEPSTYTLVAEIWQHTDHDNHSDENDIVRLDDDYRR